MDRSSRIHLASLAAVWAFLWTLLAVVESSGYIHDPSVPRWQPWTLILVLTAAVSGWSIVEIRRAPYFAVPLDPPRPWFMQQLRRVFVLAPAYVLVVFGLRHVVFAWHGAPYLHIGWPILIPFECVKAALFFAVWLGLVYGTLSMSRSRAQALQLGRVHEALVEAQLAQLQAQLRPHFLFNALNTVSALMQTDVQRADRVLTGLGDLLRASLGTTVAPTVPLSEEVRLLRLYADIMQERFAGRVAMDWQIDAASLDAPVPALLLQPLLENAFKYGVELATGNERIRVAAQCVDDRLELRVHNGGSSLDVAWRPGVGIGNCRERLRVLYDGRASIELSGDSPTGVVAAISLPLARVGA